jgi:hypothetical protein
MPAAKLSYPGSAQAVLHLGAFTGADMTGNRLPERKIDFDAGDLFPTSSRLPPCGFLLFWCVA